MVLSTNAMSQTRSVKRSLLVPKRSWWHRFDRTALLAVRRGKCEIFCLGQFDFSCVARHDVDCSSPSFFCKEAAKRLRQQRTTVLVGVNN